MVAAPTPEDKTTVTQDQAYSQSAVKRSETRQKIALGLALVVLTVAYYLLWWNRYLGVSSAWWAYTYAKAMLAGKVPYRDFYLFIPPLHVFRYVLLTRIFGDRLLLFRGISVLDHVLMGVVLFYWLTRHCRPVCAFLGALLASIVFPGDLADFAVHHHESVLWGLLAGFAGSVALRANGWRRTIALISTGFLAGLCFLSKQTVGPAVTVCIPAVMVLVNYNRKAYREAARNILLYAAGWIVPVALTLLWLWSQGALGAFVDQVFLRGPASKGNLLVVFTRPILGPFTMLSTGFAAMVALVLLASALHRKWRGKGLRPLEPPRASVAVATCALAILGGALFGQTPGSLVLRALSKISQEVVVYVGIIGIAYLVVRQLAKCLRKTDCEAGEFLLLVLVSFTMMYCLGLSWHAYEPMVMPCLGVVIACLLEETSRRGLLKLRRRVLVGVTLAIFFAVGRKLVRPFEWGEWTEPAVISATAASRQPALAGFRLAPYIATALDRTVDLVQSHSRPGQPILVFPDMPVIYALSHRMPATSAYVHWFDVAPDFLIRQDGERLKQDPPPVMVVLELSEKKIEFNEQIFRGGARSAQRGLMGTIETLARSYKEIYSFNLLPPEVHPTEETEYIRVYARVSEPVTSELSRPLDYHNARTPDVAHALVRAASRLVSTPGLDR